MKLFKVVVRSVVFEDYIVQAEDADAAREAWIDVEPCNTDHEETEIESVTEVRA